MFYIYAICDEHKIVPIRSVLVPRFKRLHKMVKGFHSTKPFSINLMGVKFESLLKLIAWIKHYDVGNILVENDIFYNWIITKIYYHLQVYEPSTENDSVPSTWDMLFFEKMDASDFSNITRVSKPDNNSVRFPLTCNLHCDLDCRYFRSRRLWCILLRIYQIYVSDGS